MDTTGRIVIYNASNFKIGYIARGISEIEKVTSDYPRPMEIFEQWHFESNSIFAVAKQNGKLIGFMFCRNQKTEIKIVDLVVHPEHRNNGIAKKFIEQLIDYFLGLKHGKIKRITTTVKEENIAALRLFAKCNFAATKILPNFYQAQDGIVFMFQKTPLFIGKRRFTFPIPSP